MTDSPISDPTPTIAPKAKGLIARVQDILLRPAPTWDVIATEGGSVQSLLTSYVFPLAAIGPVIIVVAMTVFTLGFGLIPGLIAGIAQFVGSLVAVFLLAVLADALAPSFGGQKNFGQAFKLSAYALTAAWVAGLGLIVPILGMLICVVGGLYSLYLFYIGVPRLMKAPEDKSVIYTLAVALAAAVIMSVVMWAAALTAGAGLFGAMGGFGGWHHAASVSDDGKVSGTINVNGMKIDLDKAQAAADKIQAEAEAQKNGTTTVKVADAQALLGLMPANFMGAARTDDSTQSGGVGGITTSQARGSYTVNGNPVTLEVVDLGSVSGLGGMVTAMNVNSSSSSATGYSKVSTENGMLISEEYDRESKYGKYSVVRNGRISVEASGTVDSIDTLKNLVNGVDGGRLDALSKS